MNRIRTLLENIWICKDIQKDEYYKVKHEIPLFQRFARELLGWKLINTERLLKLEKIPVHAESFMGIQEFLEIRDYCFLCVILMFLEDKEEQERFLLSELIDYVETRLKTSMEIDWTSFSQRKSLVRALQYMEKNNMLRVYEGSGEGFGQESGSEVLYVNTGHSRYFATTFPQDISGFHLAEDFETSQLEEIDSDRGRIRINRVYRQLVACPQMYWESIEDADSLYLKNQRNWVAKNLEENLGGRLDIHKNAAFWMVEEDDCYGKVHPRDAILPEAVLLVCSVIRDRIDSGIWLREADECVYISEDEFDDLILGCHRRWKDAWGFVILDGRRIGDSIWLYKEVGSSRIPLDKTELKKALGDETPFTDVPGDYKKMVNKYLFGFGRAEQYEQFIRLLVKVRAPKFSKEFKPSKVTEILNDSLQTLTDEDLRPMVDAMEKMDGIQGTLEQLRRAAGDVRAIRNEYGRYNRYMLGKKGQAYLTARKAAMQAQAQRDKQKLDKADYQREQSQKRNEEKAFRERDKLAAVELESLADTDLEDMDAKLDKARLDEKEEQKRKARIEERIRKSREHILDCDRRMRDLQGQESQGQSEVEEEKEELKSIQETMRWAGHEKVLEIVEACDVQRAGDVMGELRTYQRAVAVGKGAIEKHGRDRRQLDEITEEAEGCRKDKEEKRTALEYAEQKTEHARDACIQQLYAQNKQNQEWKIPEETLGTVEKLLLEYQSAGDARRINQQLQRVYQECKDKLTGSLWEKGKELEEQECSLGELEDRRTAIQNSKELEPERREVSAVSRKRLEEAGIMAVPFYKTVEFAEGMEPEECARLESQLSDMGLLDALVVTEADFARIKEEFPEFADCVIQPLEKGKSCFPRLRVNHTIDSEIRKNVENILSHISEQGEQEGSYVWMTEKGYFRQGILLGKAARKQEAEYVGSLARAQKKERLLRQLAEEIEQARRVLQILAQEKEQLENRMGTLELEYSETFSTEQIDLALETERRARLASEQAEDNYSTIEKKLDMCRQNANRSYQEMLSACRSFPYGRTVEEYSEADDAIQDYLQGWQNIYSLLLRLEKVKNDLATQQEFIEREENSIDEAEFDKRDAVAKIAEFALKITQYEEYLNQPEIREKAQRREEIKREREEIREKIIAIGQRLAVIENELNRLTEEEERIKNDLIQKAAAENLCRKYFEEELDLKLVFERGTESLEVCAREAGQRMREDDKDRDVSMLTTALHQAYASHNSNLVSYGTFIEECFEEAEAGSGALRKRLRIVSVWNGKKLYLEEFYQVLKATIEETSLLIQQKDRELFEDILSKTISQQLTDRIAESRKWVQDMSGLMKLETSMGLYFSLDWKPKTAGNDQELDIKELEKILLRDYTLLGNDDIEKVAAHFRSKIKTEKQRAEEAGETINYMDLVRDALDYRRWFEFQMYYYRNNEGRKNLTNSAFNKFSGGEKAMAMYVPLFAAVNAQYQKAENRDHPRIIALDEAFAGVDDKNISSMFKLVEDMDFDYIMNSQALWGCFETVPALRISELLRPLNSQVITVIHYTWNGHERVLDEQ